MIDIVSKAVQNFIYQKIYPQKNWQIKFLRKFDQWLESAETDEPTLKKFLEVLELDTQIIQNAINETLEIFRTDAEIANLKFKIEGIKIFRPYILIMNERQVLTLL